ncbi:MAG: extracellular solute-binding protein [Micromonosporaceae bacterium]|nr:extracellular solute-binding protein [Micromonosporaceae bacterium]
MTQRRFWPVALAATLAVTGCGSATGSSNAGSGGGTDTLVVWDWKSSDKVTAKYVQQAKADFAKKHPDIRVDFVAQPYEQYYTLLGAAIQSGKGPDVIMFNGGGQIRDRVDALLPLDRYLDEDTKRLAGWDAFGKDGKTYAAPVTLQGHPIYYNKAIYKKAGLDPDNPPTTWDAFVSNCTTITKATGASCISVGNKEGYGIQFFLSGLGSGVLTPAEYDAWIAGRRDWTAADVRTLFELWKQADDRGLNTKGANSTALFNDAFSTFESGKAANMIGLMSDVGHWKDFGQFLGADNVGVMVTPKVTATAVPTLPYDGGIGYGVAKWTKAPDTAADLIRSLTSTSALQAFYTGAGAIVSDTTVSTADAGPAVARIVAAVPSGRPALHVALSSKTQELLGRLSQQLLSGSVTVDDVLRQLADSDEVNG